MASSYSVLAHNRSSKSNERFQSFPMPVHDLNAEVQPTKPKRVRNLRRNPFNNFYKETPSSFKTKPYNKILDGFLLLEASKIENPNEIIVAKLNGQGICDTIGDDLKYFTNLSQLDLSDNFVKLEKLVNLESLTDLNLMCNKITSIPPLNSAFKSLEILNLSFNKIHAVDIQNLSSLKKLEVLDLSNNELCTLPETLSGFRALKELNVSGNSFSTDSVLFSASILFKALSSIKTLQKLDLSRNKLRGIHSECLQENSFSHLKELDFSQNWVDSHQNLMYAVKMKNLQVLIVTKNPFVQNKEIAELESVLSAEIGCTLVYEDIFSKKKSRLPYARPIAYITQDYTAAIKNQLFGVELSKDMGALGISEFDFKDQDEDIFPPALNNQAYKDIYTPNNDASTGRPNKPLFFVTETEGAADPTKSKQTRSKLDEFRIMAKMILAENKEYSKPLDLQAAYRQLRHMVKHPITYQNRQTTQKNQIYKPQKSKKTEEKQTSDNRQEIDYITDDVEEIFNRIRSV
jgi:Leucine rich repeat/Leucine Rich Repeat